LREETEQYWNAWAMKKEKAKLRLFGPIADSDLKDA